MKVSFAPLVVLFVSTALVDAIAEKQTQGSSSLTMETPATEMNAKEVDAPKNFEVESKESRPEDAEPPSFLAENDEKKTDSIKDIKAVDDENSENVKSDDDDEKDDKAIIYDDDDEEDDNVKFDDEDENLKNVKIDDDEKDDVKSDEANEKDDVKSDEANEKDDVKSDDDNEKDDDINAADDEKDIENTETAVEELKDQSEELVNSPDDEETTQNYSVSTVYTTITSTVTDCEALVTVCPEIGRVVTKTISLYTTICPETTSAPSVPLVTAPAIQDLDNISYLTKTVETTLWYTVTECPPQEADCFVGLEKSSVATYLDVQEMTYENPHTVNENAPFPTTTFSRPYVTGSPSNYLPAPQSNVTMPVVPHNPTYDGASAKNFDGFVMYLGLAVAATATLFLQGWY